MLITKITIPSSRLRIPVRKILVAGLIMYLAGLVAIKVYPKILPVREVTN